MSSSKTSEDQQVGQQDCQQTSLIESVANDVRAEMIGHLDLDSVHNLALTGPVFRDYITENLHLIYGRLIRSEVSPSLLQIALARCHAENASWKPADGFWPNGTTKKLMSSITAFIEDWIRPEHRSFHYVSTIQNFSVREQREIIRFHGIVSSIGHQLANRAVTKVFWKKSTDGKNMTNIPIEKEPVRFQKSLYILETVRILFPRLLEMRGVFHKFWMRLAPWEVHQVRCVQEQLEVHVLGESQIGWQIFKLGLAGLPRLTKFGELIHECAIDRRRAWADADEFYHINSVSSKHMSKSGCFSLDLAPLLEKYDADIKNDDGPISAWYYNLARNFVESPSIFSKVESHRSLSCSECVTSWGYVMWDRETLDWLTDGTVPSMAEMAVGGTGVLVRPSKMPKTTGGQSAALCRCCCR